MSTTATLKSPATRPGTRGAADQVIHEARRARQTAHAAEVRQLELAVEWALLHPVPEGGYAADWSQDSSLWAEGSSALAGEGCPEVAEFAPVELAAALDISLDAGRALIADALDLTHRLPRLWAHLHLCVYCRRYQAQSQLLARLAPGLAPQSAPVSEEMKARWRAQIAAADTGAAPG